MEFKVSAIFVLHALCVIAENAWTIQYANIYESVVLICKKKNGTEGLRWLRDTYILSDGQRINKKNPWHSKFSIDIKSDSIHYNLRIANVTADDFGLYLCEMQEGRGISRQRVTLEYKEFQTLSSANPVSKEIQEIMTEFKTLGTANPVSKEIQEIMTEFQRLSTEHPVSQEIREIITDFQTISTEHPVSQEIQEIITHVTDDKSVTRIIQTTFPDREKHAPKNEQYYSYMIFAAGFVVVFLMSIGCNIFIGNYRHRKIRTKEGQHKMEIIEHKSVDQNRQESGSVGEISNFSSKYETINENEMVLPNSIITNIKLQKQAKTLTRKSSTNLDQIYLDVIGDDVYSVRKEAEMNSCLNVQTSKSTIKKATVKSVKPYKKCTENYIDDEIASYCSMEESENSTTSISQIHLEMCRVNQLVNREDNSTKKPEYMNNYFTLDSRDMDDCHSYCAAVRPCLDTMNQHTKVNILMKKRNSCP